MQKRLSTNVFRATRDRLAGNDVVLGCGVVLTAVVVLTTTTVLYLHPPGRHTLSFDTTDAAALSPGEEVRVAGVAVGKITGLSLGPDAVRVQASISANTFVGDRSRIDVRMLTPVGGYAVTIIPIGDTPLGDAVIPADRVSVPYSIGDLLQAAPHVTDTVDAATVDADIDQVAQALQHNSTSVGSLIAGMNSIAAVMDHQREQVDRVTDLVAEYMQSFNTSRDFVFDLVRQIDVVVTTYDNTHAGFDEAYRLLGDVLMSIVPLERYYLEHKDQLHDAITRVQTSIRSFDASMAPAIDKLRGLRAQLTGWLTPQGMATVGGGTVLASDVCIPLPGRRC